MAGKVQESLKGVVVEEWQRGEDSWEWHWATPRLVFQGELVDILTCFSLRRRSRSDAWVCDPEA